MLAKYLLLLSGFYYSSVFLQQQNISQMNRDQKGGRNKPKLLIQIEDFQNRTDQIKKQQLFNGVDVKPLRSAKNLYQMKQLGFNELLPEICQTARKLEKLKKLQEDKMKLMRSLEILKESAVSAIAQKQDEITKLKNRTSFIQDQNIETYEQRLNQQRQMRMALEQQKDELLNYLKYEKQMHVVQLEEKENLIEQLCEEISSIRSEIQILQRSDQTKTKTIRLLQEENSQLSEQLELSSIATALKQRSEHFFNLEESKVNPTLSIASSNQSKKYYSYVQTCTSQHFFQNDVDKSYMNEKLQEIKKAHQEQLLDLRTFYEKRITGLRQIYLRQLNLPTESSDVESTMRKRSGSNLSISQSCKKSEIKKQIEGLQLNLKGMYSIEEMENQLQTERQNAKNLRNEIKMQNLSECASIQQRFNTNQDTESQFTTKYFQVPNRFVKKNRSSDSITITHDEQNKMSKKKPNKEVQSSKQCSRQPSKAELDLNPKPQTSNKTIFAAGFVSGILFTTVLGFVFSKKRFSLK